MHKFNPTHFFAATDLVIVGQNPEMADYDNPRGDIIGSAAYVYAEDAKGYRVCQHVATGWEEEVLEKAEKLASALNNRLAAGKLPVAFNTWQEARPAYGSDAFVETNQGYEDYLEERMTEDCF